jgi:riboflavin kinase/FMN adenylyltransferase
MKLFRKIEDIKEKFRNPVLTIGNFDGVHIGHRRIFDIVKEKASKINGDSVVFTFEPHPVKLLIPNKGPFLITTFEEKIRLIEESDIDIIVCPNFDMNFANQTPREFIENVFVNIIGIKEVVIGYDYLFGKNRKGNINTIKDFGKEYGFNVDVIKPIKVDNTIVSCTKIREYIKKGMVKEASLLLGRDYYIDGYVISGRERGRKLGFPTANLNPYNELIPKSGVYVAKIVYSNRMFEGVVNIGNNPTFSDTSFSIEAHMFNFNKDIYGEKIRIIFIDRLREEVAFKNPDDLKRQIEIDIITAKKILNLSYSK